MEVTRVLVPPVIKESIVPKTSMNALKVGNNFLQIRILMLIKFSFCFFCRSSLNYLVRLAILKNCTCIPKSFRPVCFFINYIYAL